MHSSGNTLVFHSGDLQAKLGTTFGIKDPDLTVPENLKNGSLRGDSNNRHRDSNQDVHTQTMGSESSKGSGNTANVINTV